MHRPSTFAQPAGEMHRFIETLPGVASLKAEAAAAVEKPTHMTKAVPQRVGFDKSYLLSMPPRPSDIRNSIHKAQQEAERKRNPTSAPSKSDDLESRIRYAQMANSWEADPTTMQRPGSYGYGFAPHRRNGPWLPSAQELMGNWVDMQGNSVMVYSVDAYEMRLMAAVSRPAARDLQLGLRPTPDGEGWICGNATFDPWASSLEEVHWIGPHGRYSVWVRGRT